jgi:hypothetical protein
MCYHKSLRVVAFEDVVVEIDYLASTTTFKFSPALEAFAPEVIATLYDRYDVATGARLYRDSDGAMCLVVPTTRSITLAA